MCQLRPYRPGDEPAVFALVARVLAEYDLAADPDGTDRDLADIGRSYAVTGGLFKVIDHDGAVIGSYGLFRVSAQTCELRKMYLDRAHRGKGWGRRMMEDAFREARALGFTEMVLETNTCLKEALQLYRASGFEEVRPAHLADRCNLAMRRSL